MRYRALGRIRLILADDPKCLHASDLTSHNDRRSKSRRARDPVDGLDKLCRCQSRGPVPKLALRGGNGRLIVLAESGSCMPPVKRSIVRSIDVQTFGRDEVRMRGDGTIWQLYRLVIFSLFNKRAYS